MSKSVANRTVKMKALIFYYRIELEWSEFAYRWRDWSSDCIPHPALQPWEF